MYKVRLEKFGDSLSTDIYNMRVLEMIKEGGYYDFKLQAISLYLPGEM